MYLVGFGCVAASLPNLRLLMSIGQFIILGSWLIEGVVQKDLGQKFTSFFKNNAALAFSLIFFIHLVGLAYTANLGWGLDLVRILLPFLLLPVVVASIPRFTEKELMLLMAIFVISTGLTSIYGSVLQLNTIEAITSFRAYSPLISHIRMALLVAMAIFCIIWYLEFMGWMLRVCSLILLLWFWYYLNLMHSIQGMAIVVLGSAILLLARSNRFPRVWRSIIRMAALVIPLLAFTYVSFCYWAYYDVDPNALGNLETHSVAGDVYYHDLEDPMVENGYYVWVNISWAELKVSWEDRSDLVLDDFDRMGQPISSTLIRYMSSKGFKKDAEGMSQMSAEDIANVEAGIPNIRMMNGSGLRLRVDQVIFEIDRYRANHSPDGNSFTMRFEFWRAAAEIIKKNFWLGVGTGDTPEVFAKQYVEMSSPLAESHRLRAHNEYLTIFVSFGVVGFFLFLFALFFPIIKMKACKHGLTLAFLITVLVSFLTDDTLERQAGATFVAYFYCILVFLSPQKEQSEVATFTA